MILYRRLYRSLLKASKPFSSPSPNAAAMSCLLHRSGLFDTLDMNLAESDSPKEKLDDDDFNDATTTKKKSPKKKSPESNQMPTVIEETENPSKSSLEDDDIDAFRSYEEENDDHLPSHVTPDPHKVIFRRLLREALNSKSSEKGLRRMQFPSHVDTTILPKILSREFRRPVSSQEDLDTRREVAFLALRALNLKLGRANRMQSRSFEEKPPDVVMKRLKYQSAKHVTPYSSTSGMFDFLRPGTYLLAHPQMTGYFRRSVIVILDQTADKDGSGGTYGLIVNRSSNQTLADVLRIIPEKLRNTSIVDSCKVKDGGPVHMSVQMIHACNHSLSEIKRIGGTALQNDDTNSNDTHDNGRVIYYQGDIFEASKAIESGDIAVDDVCLYVGASCWEVGQLENEIESGYWIPCRGPPEMTLTGQCETVAAPTKECPLVEDLWLSMMCALGHDEAMLAHWHYHSDSLGDNNEDEDIVDDSIPCDIFG